MKSHSTGFLGLDSHFYQYVLPLLVTEVALWVYAFESDARTCQVLLGLVGLWWCLAALWVEVKIEHTYPGFDYANPSDPEMKAYRPFCDFAPWANCSYVLMSPSGRFLRYFGIAKQGGGESWLDTVRGWIDVPNPTLGVLFFTCHLFYNVLVDIVFLFQDLPWIGAGFFNFANWALPYCFFIACCGVAFMAVWLATKLFCVLKDVCVVCVSMYVVIGMCVPTMKTICESNSSTMRGFGATPALLLYPLLLIDGAMLVAVLLLYFLGQPTKSADAHYIQINDSNSEDA
jgi:uncharacterized membrane protein